MLNLWTLLRAVKHGSVIVKRLKVAWTIKRLWINLSKGNSRAIKMNQTTLRNKEISKNIITKASLTKDMERKDLTRARNTILRWIKIICNLMEETISSKYSKRNPIKRRNWRRKTKICNISHRLKGMWKPKTKTNTRKRSSLKNRQTIWYPRTRCPTKIVSHSAKSSQHSHPQSQRRKEKQLINQTQRYHHWKFLILRSYRNQAPNRANSRLSKFKGRKL